VAALGVLPKPRQSRRNDVDEALGAAAAIGDDRLQHGPGRGNPERWTHALLSRGSMRFKKGFASGNVTSCRTSEATAIEQAP
jgi:predicted metalloprotease